MEKITLNEVLNGFTEKTDVGFVYAETSSGTPMKIENNDFFKLLPIKDYGIVSGSLDEIGPGFGYNASGDGSDIAGPFFCVGNNKCRFQIKISLNSAGFKFRASDFNGKWSTWKSVSFT